MSKIKLRNINNYICRDINLDIKDKEFLVLWGHTGAGKSTFLNVISGLVKYEGTVLLNGISVEKIPIFKRGIGYLFQDLILFPHLDVKTNVAYGLKMQKNMQDDEIHSKVDELLNLMDIKYLADCYPKDLSRGERQRVALARAVAPEPEIMLFDEPLNSLDLKTAKFLMNEIKKFRHSLGLTVVYVTHCFEEAVVLADRIVVLKRGMIHKIAKPAEIFPEAHASCNPMKEIGFCERYRVNMRKMALALED